MVYHHLGERDFLTEGIKSLRAPCAIIDEELRRKMEMALGRLKLDYVNAGTVEFY